ncbi:MAG TPA: carboxypeptidase-like regulatory domain-containing protein, partial [Stellaceae bacterium]|nr:carboxypeptidase-like regulatory domain-containing protein [Stellaceae bacterium]
MNMLRLSAVSFAVLAASAFAASAQAPSPSASATPSAPAPAAAPGPQSAQVQLPAFTHTPPTGLKSISGTVTSVHGPEAGVWVIAETTELPTKFAKIVVTDDKGRYLIPDLPEADYGVWVRGYGLVDSPKVKGIPGNDHLDLTAIPAPTAADAAMYYPAIYWYSMVKIPGADQFGGKSAIPAKETLDDYLTNIKNRGCVGCHQLGMLRTRTLPAAFANLDPEQAWIR